MPKMNRQQTRQVVFNKYSGHCAYCGCEIKLCDMQVDHIHPQAKAHWKRDDKSFRLHHIDNFNPACRVCNIKKSSLDIEGFRSNILNELRLLKEYNIKYRFALRYGLIEEKPETIVFYFEKHPVFGIKGLEPREAV